MAHFVEQYIYCVKI